MRSKVVALVMSGGVGSRLWPLSTAKNPKPFINLNGETLLARTYKRANLFADAIVTITNRDYYDMSRNILDGLQLKSDFLLEPFPRNTAAAIFIATSYIKSKFGSSIIVVLSADHLIEDEASFIKNITESIKLACNDYLVTIGIKPLYPSEAYGYISKAESVGLGFRVDSFAEKPCHSDAVRFIRLGYLWNAGIFVFNTEVILVEYQTQRPEYFSNMMPIHFDPSEYIHVIDSEFYQSFNDEPVDKAIFEVSKRVAVIQADFRWTDVGSWVDLSKEMPRDLDDNSCIGNSTALECTNTLIFNTTNTPVAAVGLSNQVIVRTDEAVLVANKDSSQLIKKLQSQLSFVERNEETIRPWGKYSVLDTGLGYKIKRIEVLPKHSLSLQSHKFRSEHWVVVSGVANIELEGNNKLLRANESTYIAPHQKHRLSNDSVELLVIIEVQCGMYLEEDDIERYQDKYGRE